GALLEGFDTMVHLSDNSKIAVFEGDEYLSSPIDRRPKFHHYHPDIAILTGIAWDHMNVFPTFDNYVEQFALFVEKITPGGTFIYFEQDENIRKIISRANASVRLLPYSTFPYFVEQGVTYLDTPLQPTPLRVFGKHNLQNISAAYLACKELGISDKDFFQGIASYNGAAKRLQKIAENGQSVAYLDFAHSPSKLQATINAVKEQYPSKKLIACMELHTFSSLNADFLPQYRQTMDQADEAIVFFNPEVIRHKRLPEMTPEDVQKGFGNRNVKVFTDNRQLLDFLNGKDYTNAVLLIMTSGNFSGINIQELADRLIRK
ncbi:MAG: peptidoglycan synthetase, partial [Odoribacter sp.]|nr:peptidoglycan synthetase [Odoribacter sp.]